MTASDGWDSVTTDIERSELESHLATSVELPHEDPGYAVNTGTAPTRADEALHFLGQHPEETFSRPVPGANPVGRQRVVGAERWSVHGVTLGAPGASPTLRLAGKRKGRRAVDVIVAPGADVYIGSDSNFTIATADCLRINNSAGTVNLVYTLPTEDAVYASAAAPAVVTAAEFFDE